jgi:16S rRNA (adenine1518-N6/adenine1519-N6)-dimethyltransferase
MYKAKKSLGQHFLTDQSIVDDIVSHAQLQMGDHVWEIGPGLGILTDSLVTHPIQLKIFEIDHDLIPSLKKKYTEKCTIIHHDILKIDWKSEIDTQKIKIVTNLPYQISSPFLYKVAENHSCIDSVIVMLQKEVAKRLCATPCKKEYGVLTLKTKFYFDTIYLFDVPPHKFSPPPAVDSAVIKLTQRKDIPHIDDLVLFWKIIEVAFSSRRKTLRNNLKKIIDSDLSNLPIDLSRRGETLSESEYISLYEHIKKFI